MRVELRAEIDEHEYVVVLESDRTNSLRHLFDVGSESLSRLVNGDMRLPHQR